MKKENFWKKIIRKWYTYGIISLIIPLIFLILVYITNCPGGWDSKCFGYFLSMGLFNWFLDIDFGTGNLGFFAYIISGMLQYFIIGSVIGLIIIRILKLKNK